MPNIKIDDKEYDLDRLSDEAKAQVNSLHFVDAEIARMQANIAVFQTAKIGYLAALVPHLKEQTTEVKKH